MGDLQHTISTAEYDEYMALKNGRDRAAAITPQEVDTIEKLRMGTAIVVPYQEYCDYLLLLNESDEIRAAARDEAPPTQEPHPQKATTAQTFRTIPSERRPMSEGDGYLIEAALHHGFIMLDDDGTVFLAHENNIIDLLRSYRPSHERCLEEFDGINQWIINNATEIYNSKSYTPGKIAEVVQDLALKIIADAAHLINNLSADSHAASVRAGWWTDLKTGEDLHGKRNIGELLLLVVTEISEAFEGVRKNKMDDHLPHRKAVEVELADALIRIFDFAGAMGLDLGRAYIEKRAYNDSRPDHKPENRRKADGKKF